MIPSKEEEEIPSLEIYAMAQRVKRLSAMQETQVWSLGWGDPLEKEIGNPLQFYCLENPMDRGDLWAIVPGIAKSWTRLSN